MGKSLSAARQMFDQIFSGDAYSFLEDLSKSEPPTFESEYLECKGGQKLGDPLPIFSEAVSGFANTAGGVLIFGLDARREGASNVDVISDVSLVPDALAVRSRLQQNGHATADPPVVGIEIREVVRQGSKEGFVVCFIPEGSSKPHRAEHVKNKPYQLRVVDSFINPNPSILRTMFFPQSSADIRLSVTPEWDWSMPDVGQQWPVTYVVAIHNLGQQTAHELMIGGTMATITLDPLWREVQNSFKQTFYVCEYPLHPNMSRHVFSFEVPAVVPYGHHQNMGPRPEPQYLRIPVYGRDMQSRVFGRVVVIDYYTRREPIWLRIIDGIDGEIER